MQQVHSQGVQEFSASTRDRPNLVKDYLDFTAKNIQTVRVERVAVTPGFGIHVRSRSVGGFTLAWAVATVDGLRELRDTAEIAADGRDLIFLNMQLCGESNVSQLGRSQRVEQGSCTLVSTSEPYVVENGKRGRGDGISGISFFMPRDFVNQRVVIGERFCLRYPNAPGGFHHLVCGTVNLFQENAWHLTADEFLKSARVVAELVLLAVDGSPDVSSDERSVRAANFARAKYVVRKRLSDPDLTLSNVAQEAGLSLNYVQRLFRDQGLTMYEYLKGERLRRARELLEWSASRVITITDVCFECGFSDRSYFSRVFKRAFGISPTDALRRH